MSKEVLLPRLTRLDQALFMLAIAAAAVASVAKTNELSTGPSRGRISSSRDRKIRR